MHQHMHNCILLLLLFSFICLCSGYYHNMLKQNHSLNHTTLRYIQCWLIKVSYQFLVSQFDRSVT